MRILHVVKTSDGAVWAAKLAKQLVSLGVELHAALPTLEGNAIPFWKSSGAILHECDLDAPVHNPIKLPLVMKRARRLIYAVSPDLIHSHFVGTTLMMRLALGRSHRTPRVFQVPGPLHLEHPLYRHLELSSAGKADYWIASSRCIANHYSNAGVSGDRVFLSYYGDEKTAPRSNLSGFLRAKANAASDDILVGSISWMYPPKRYLGQRIGLKAHEDLIAALGIVCRKNPRVRGIIAGAAWGGAEWYERRLRRLAYIAAGDRILFTGSLPFAEAKQAWRDLDLVVHVPVSENCGGVIEPLLAGVPVIASNVGGLPEVVFDGITGRLVPPRNPQELARVILECLDNPELCRLTAHRGRALVNSMFDVRRTAVEVLAVYRHILAAEPAPLEFDSRSAASGDDRSEMVDEVAHRTQHAYGEMPACLH